MDLVEEEKADGRRREKKKILVKHRGSVRGQLMETKYDNMYN